MVQLNHSTRCPGAHRRGDLSPARRHVELADDLQRRSLLRRLRGRVLEAPRERRQPMVGRTPVAGQPTSTRVGDRSALARRGSRSGPDGSLWCTSRSSTTSTAPFRVAAPHPLHRPAGLGARLADGSAPPCARSRITFTDATRLVLELPHPATVRLAVFDYARPPPPHACSDGTAAASETRVEWDGADDRGRQRAAGDLLCAGGRCRREARSHPGAPREIGLDSRASSLAPSTAF